jgi:hypothetical protein
VVVNSKQSGPGGGDGGDGGGGGGLLPSYVQISPSRSTAASFKPSLEEVMDDQFFAVPAGMLSVQVAPESADVQIFPG